MADTNTDKPADTPTGTPAETGFTHLDDHGRARMVDVTAKQPSHRRAKARGRIAMSPDTAAALADGTLQKGDALAVARVAGIQGAKKTSELVPLCHPLMLGSVSVDFRLGADFVEVEATVETFASTGVEMEALTACSVAALAIYDMCKARDKDMVVGDICLVEKTGGKSGDYRRA